MSEELNESLLLTYRRARIAHSDTFALLDNVKTVCRADAEPGTVIDAVLLLKKTVKYVDETRKEINRTLDFIQRIGALHAMQTEDNSLVGQLGKGYASTSQQGCVPDREADPAGYAELMEAIGAPNLDVIRPSFTGIEALITKLNTEGKQIPAGLAHCRMVDKYTLTALVKKGVDLDALSDHVASQHAGDPRQANPYQTPGLIDDDNPF